MFQARVIAVWKFLVMGSFAMMRYALPELGVIEEGKGVVGVMVSNAFSAMRLA